MDIPKTLDEWERVEKEKTAFLHKLLKDKMDNQDSLLAIKGIMGNTCSYVTTVTLHWIAEKVRFANQLPIWDDKKDDNNRIIINKVTLDEIRQREPDWRRQWSLVHYLAEHDTRKFPPILIIAWQKWVNESTNDAWKNSKACNDSIVTSSLDLDKSFFIINYANTNFYALDGQHRLMAILGFKELLDKEKLYAQTAEKRPRIKRVRKLDELIDRVIKRTHETKEAVLTRFQFLLNEKIGVEIIPAVLKGETSLDSLKRLRSIFVHVNKSAKKLGQGEIALLDEDNGYAVVARRIMVTHKLFAGDRVDTKNRQLSEKSICYTTLVTLMNIAEHYLQSKYDWSPEYKEELQTRPHDSELDQAQEELFEYFDFLCKLPSHDALVMHHEKSASDYRLEDNNENILFRPIAQEALVEAVAELVQERHKSLKEIFDVLVAKEEERALVLRDRTSIWYGVLCDILTKKMRIQKFYKNLCVKLFIHLLGGGIENNARKELLAEFAKARKVDVDQYINLKGETVSEKEVILPPPWV